MNRSVAVSGDLEVVWQLVLPAAGERRGLPASAATAVWVSAFPGGAALDRANAKLRVAMKSWFLH